MKKINAMMWQPKHMQYVNSMPNPAGLFGLFALPINHSSIQSPSLKGTAES